MLGQRSLTSGLKGEPCPLPRPSTPALAGSAATTANERTKGLAGHLIGRGGALVQGLFSTGTAGERMPRRKGKLTTERKECRAITSCARRGSGMLLDNFAEKNMVPRQRKAARLTGGERGLRRVTPAR